MVREGGVMLKKIIPFLTLASIFFSPVAYAVNVDESILPFDTVDINGSRVNLGENIGQKVIILVFWASWCPLCESEVPLLNEITKTFSSDKVALYGINIDKNDSPARALTFVNKNKIEYPVIYDKGSKITSSYKITGVPTVIITDRKGVVVFRRNYVPEMDSINIR